MIDFRKLQASNGDSYIGYFNNLRVADIIHLKNKDGSDEYILYFYEGDPHYFWNIEAAKAEAEELLTEWLTTAIKDLPEDKLAELGVMRRPEILFHNCGHCLSSYPPGETCPNGCK